MKWNFFFFKEEEEINTRKTLTLETAEEFTFIRDHFHDRKPALQTIVMIDCCSHDRLPV